MISGISGGGMPSMDAMRQMQQKMFARADGDGSGGLDATEFESMVKSSPMGGKGQGGMSVDDAFKKIDGDGDGKLTQTEMEDAHQQMMQRFQSTMQIFGQGGERASAGGSQDSMQTLLDAIGNDGRDEQGGARRAMSATDDLVAQLRSLIDRVGSTYGSVGAAQGSGLLASA